MEFGLWLFAVHGMPSFVYSTSFVITDTDSFIRNRKAKVNTI